MLNLIGVIVTFIIIIFLIRKKFNNKFLEDYKFGLLLILGSVIIGIFSLQIIQPVDILKTIIEASIYSFKEKQIVTETLEIALLTTLIFVLAKTMQETGSIKKLIDSLRSFFSKGGILGVIPAVYGLMPAPGGAYLSAPMIDHEGDKYKLDNNQKNLLNVWFRHIWFPIYPVSNAMILICSIEFSNIDIYKLVIVEVPAFFASIIIGLVFLKMFIKKAPVQKTSTKTDLSGLIFFLPPLLPLIVYAILYFLDFPQTRSFLIGVFFSIILLFFLLKISFGEYLKILKKSFSLKLFVAIFGIMIFRGMFETSQANVLIADILGNTAAPALIIIIFIPFLLGFLTGYNLGAIALSYFLVEPFFLITGISILGLTSVIFISALVGYLISPIHLCNVLSSDYLKTDPTRIYKWFIPAALLMLVIQVIFVVLILGK